MGSHQPKSCELQASDTPVLSCLLTFFFNSSQEEGDFACTGEVLCHRTMSSNTVIHCCYQLTGSYHTQLKAPCTSNYCNTSVPAIYERAEHFQRVLTSNKSRQSNMSADRYDVDKKKNPL